MSQRELEAKTQTGLTVHRQPTDEREEEEEGPVQRIQRQYGNRAFGQALARKGAGESEVAPEVEAAIQRARGSGQTLDSGVRAQMEPAFGADFGDVRVHTDAEADMLNRAVSARAFTTGQDVFFREGEYQPSSSSGKELLAHELAHVVQQNGNQVQAKLTLGQPGDRYEQEADRAARAVLERKQQLVQRMTEESVAHHQGDEEEEKQALVQGKAEDGRIGRQTEEEIVRRNPLPALAAAEWIAAAALGFVVAQEAVKQASGDISWTLDEAEGVLLPGGRADVEKYQKENPNITVTQKELVVSFWRGTETSKKAGITFGLAFSTDGKGIGNISARVIDRHDWVGWGASCKVDLMPQTFVSATGKAVIRVTLTNSWVNNLLGVDVSDGVDSGIWQLEGNGSFTELRPNSYMWVEHRLT